MAKQESTTNIISWHGSTSRKNSWLQQRRIVLVATAVAIFLFSFLLFHLVGVVLVCFEECDTLLRMLCRICWTWVDSFKIVTAIEESFSWCEKQALSLSLLSSCSDHRKMISYPFNIKKTFLVETVKVLDDFLLLAWVQIFEWATSFWSCFFFNLVWLVVI